MESAALPSVTQPNTEVKNVCSPEHMQVGKGEQYEYFSVLKKTQPCKWSTLCTEVVHFSEGLSYKLLLLEILLYFFVLEKDPTMQALCPGSTLSV